MKDNSQITKVRIVLRTQGGAWHIDADMIWVDGLPVVVLE